MRLIEVVCEAGYVDTVVGVAEQHAALDHWTLPVPAPGRTVVRLLVSPDAAQPTLDALQSVLGGSDNARVAVLAVETTLPRPDKGRAADESASHNRAVPITREALYDDLSAAARLHWAYVLLVGTSTVVAAIGLAKDNVAVVIGAMVIAPLLGPNLAFAFATALGEGRLMGAALRSLLAGLVVAVGLAVLIGGGWGPPMDAPELTARTDVGFDSLVLALAAGAAAALSLTAGLGTTLVGVMVAVALLPPAAVLGLTLGVGQFPAASGAGMLLAANVVCVNLAATLVFIGRGIGPRTGLERERARRSLGYSIASWVVALGVLVLVIAAGQ